MSFMVWCEVLRTSPERGAAPGDPGPTPQRFAARCNGTSKTSGLKDKERQASRQINGFRHEKQDHPRLCRNRHARRTAGLRARGMDGQRPTPFPAPDASIATDRNASGRSSGRRPDDRIDQRGAPPPCRRPVGPPRPALLNLPRGPNRRTGRLGWYGVRFGAPPCTAYRAEGQVCGRFPRCPDSTRADAGSPEPAPLRWAASATARGRRPAHACDARDHSPVDRLPDCALGRRPLHVRGLARGPTVSMRLPWVAASIRPLPAVRGRPLHGRPDAPWRGPAGPRGTGRRDARPARSVGGSAARRNETLTLKTWDAPSPVTLAFRPDRKAGIVPA